MVTGFSAFGTTSFGEVPFSLNGVPVLENHRELFIEGSLGVPGLMQGPGSRDAVGKGGHVQETLFPPAERIAARPASLEVGAGSMDLPVFSAVCA